MLTSTSSSKMINLQAVLLLSLAITFTGKSQFMVLVRSKLDQVRQNGYFKSHPKSVEVAVLPYLIRCLLNKVFVMSSLNRDRNPVWSFGHCFIIMLGVFRLVLKLKVNGNYLNA
jgi:hypothetical protein